MLLKHKDSKWERRIDTASESTGHFWKLQAQVGRHLNSPLQVDKQLYFSEESQQKF